MQGLMMDYQLTITPMLEHAQRLFSHKEIVTKAGPNLERYTYGEMATRVGSLANALKRLGVHPEDRVGTFAWNNFRHLELYFAVPCMGAVLHPLNIRLASEELAYIANHAADKVIFVDPTLLPAAEKLAPFLKHVSAYVIMGDHVPLDTKLSPVYAYEELVKAEDPDYPWPQLDENVAAAMCYTSGTTGNPKGVVYSHRSTYLHTMGLGMADSAGICENDTVMPVVPMFHAMAWGTPFACTFLGAKLVFPGPHLAPRDLAELMQAEKVTLAAGVPTVWIGLLALLDKEHYDLSSLDRMLVGGSAVPYALIEGFHKRHGLKIIQAWGMTEMSPLGSVSRPRSDQLNLPVEEQYAITAKAGTPAPGVEVRVMDENGHEVPWDGQSIGELQVRGPWVIRSYYNDARNAGSFSDGWFRTGDVVNISADGFIQIVDRTKDLVKSGGEWISTIDMENAIMGHPKVMEAAVIAVPHPRWQERPLACVVVKPEFKGEVTKDEIYEHLKDHFARWALPDEILFIDALPRTSVGKFDKKVLRVRYKDYTLPESQNWNVKEPRNERSPD